jgi:two-component system, NarL family, response regulator DesR
VCVGVAADGTEMAQAIRRTVPDVIVLDRHLGDVDGLALCAEVRAERRAPQVVVYTADWDPDLDTRARAAGASAAVAKERAVDELFDAVRLAVRRRGADGSEPRSERAASQLG